MPRCLAPPKPLYTASGSVPLSTSQLCSLLPGSVRSYRLFAPPQQPALSSRPFRNQRSQPGTSLLLQLLSSPVRPSGSTPAPGSPQSRMASSLSARCVSCCQSLGLAPQPPLPFRVSRPSGSKRSVASACPSARLSIPPDLPSLPAALCLFQAFQASDQRSRSATFSQACCSSNLLEPSPLCP